VCGDGHVNLAVEDCDDGNATEDDNGCSQTCVFNNVCGDGARQTYGEQCDEAGDTAACDVDCTTPRCSDGHTNTAAGEQCDDANLDDGDGCSATCQTE
jgi:cysteine-rich repeat protein